MKKLFIAAMALATIVSCSKDDNAGPALDSNNKSVAIKIENSSSTRAGEAGNTVAGKDQQSAVIDPSELMILFADANDVILKEMPLVADGADHDQTNNPQYAYGSAPESGLDGDYVFHNVPAAVTKIAIVRYEQAVEDTPADITIVPGTTELDEVAAYASEPELNLQREIDDIILYAESTLTKDASDMCVEIKGVKYYVYNATVTVAPLFARFEINNIQCDDLGALNGDNDINTFGFDALELNSLTWGAGAYSIATDELGTLYGSYKTPDGGKNYIQAPTGVWSWNVPNTAKVPSTENPLVLAMTASAHDYVVANNGAVSIKVIGLEHEDTPVEAFANENIYKLDLSFDEGDIAGQEGICVNVNVTIAKWTVKTVDPVFGK